MSLLPDSQSPDAVRPEPPAPGDSSATTTRVRNAAVLIGVVAVLLGGVALLTSGNGSAAQEWGGRVLPTPEAKPPIELTDTEGQPFDLRADTEGKLTLLMFGYTNCPDVCPINLGTLQAALDELGPEVSNSVEMVFVTADPERDTPEVLRDYLDGFSPEFRGIWGSTEQVDEAQRLANVPVAVREAPDEDSIYTVGHASQIIAYQQDDVARIVYPFGTRQQDWIRDLPRLVAGEQPTT